MRRFVMPEQAVKMRGLAARLRACALETVLPHYRLKLEASARDLEMEAARVEQQFHAHDKLAG